ncbi:hypothetical protein HN801_03110, partial [Candidatus Peregrinibacteria bacterium]|nr:hypothetical protein [Candidatus Peregrinibacteria bacterium]
QVATSLASSGTLAVEGAANIHGTLSGNTIAGFNLSDCQGATDKIVYNAASQRFECGTDVDTTIADTNTTYTAGEGLELTGTVFSRIAAFTGASLQAADSLASSGTLIVEGVATFNDEVVFGSGIIIGGVTYVFPVGDGSASGKVLATDGAGQLSWTTGGSGTANAAGQGLTVANGFVLLNSTISGSLVNFLTVSGSTVHAANTLSSSGNLIVESSVVRGSGAVTVTAAENQTGAYLYSSGAAVLALDNYLGTQSGANAHIMFGYRNTFDVSLYRSGNSHTPGSGGLVLKTLQTNANQSAFEIITNNGSVHNKVFKVTASGAVHADGAFNSTGADYAEWFKSRDTLQKGEVVCIDLTQNNAVIRCTSEADSNVMGIVSTNPAFIGNRISGAGDIMPPGYALIGLIGQVPTKVLIQGYLGGVLNIRPGDALTPSETPGYARRALPGEPTVGVALETFTGFEGDEGSVNVLISRRNSSVTVDQVEQKVLDQIASMEIEDEVEIMVADAVQAIDFSDDILTVVRQQIQEFDLRDTVISILEEAGIGTGSTLATTEGMATELGTGSVIWGIVDALQAEISQLRLSIDTLSGSDINRSPNFDSVAIEENLIIGGDARAASDFHIDGTLYTQDIFVPGIMFIDGSLSVAGKFDTNSLTVNSGAVIHGPLEIDGVLMIDGKELDLSALVSTGSMLNLSSLLVQNSLMVLGNVTIEGMAEIMGDVSIGGNLTVSGALIISEDQAGYAMIVKTGTAVTIPFGSGAFPSIPIVTASSDDFIPWRIATTTGTGFTIETAEPAERDITFMWHAALVDGEARTVKGLPGGASANDIPFHVDGTGVPISSSDIWNQCIRSQQPLDLDGQPFNCRRYHDDDSWTHPDLLIQFLWDAEVEDKDLRLIVPRGYYIVVIEDEDEEEQEVVEQEEEEVQEEEDPETGTGETVIEEETETGTGEVLTGTGETIIEDEPETGTGETIIEDEVETGTGETIIEDEPETGTGETVVEEDEPETGTGETIIEYEGQAGTGEVLLQ